MDNTRLFWYFDIQLFKQGFVGSTLGFHLVNLLKIMCEMKFEFYRVGICRNIKVVNGRPCVGTTGKALMYWGRCMCPAVEQIQPAMMVMMKILLSNGHRSPLSISNLLNVLFQSQIIPLEPLCLLSKHQSPLKWLPFVSITTLPTSAAITASISTYICLRI